MLCQLYQLEPLLEPPYSSWNPLFQLEPLYSSWNPFIPAGTLYSSWNPFIPAGTLAGTPLFQLEPITPARILAGAPYSSWNPSIPARTPLFQLEPLYSSWNSCWNPLFQLEPLYFSRNPSLQLEPINSIWNPFIPAGTPLFQLEPLYSSWNFLFSTCNPSVPAGILYSSRSPSTPGAPKAAAVPTPLTGDTSHPSPDPGTSRRLPWQRFGKKGGSLSVSPWNQKKKNQKKTLDEILFSPRCHGFVPDPSVFVDYPGRLPKLREPLGSTHPSLGNKHREQHPGEKLLCTIPKPQGTREVLLIKQQSAVSKGRRDTLGSILAGAGFQGGCRAPGHPG
ncbi:uncharacterized protein ACIQIH_018366 [Cyanocitta cristata]